MKILFDQGTPVPLRKVLRGHEVDTLYERGWSELVNGVLLRSAEDAAYDVFVTTDRNLKYQQNLTDRKLAIVVILTASWPRIKLHERALCKMILAVSPGDFKEFSVAE